MSRIFLNIQIDGLQSVMTNVQKSDGDPSSVVNHVAKIIKYVSKFNMVHENSLMHFSLIPLGLIKEKALDIL